MISHPSPHEPIDIVILWVDETDPYFRQAHSTALDAARKAGIVVRDKAGRHRDNGELFFLLRSIEQNVPWYRRIHLVTNGQAPSYVDCSTDRLRLVSHADIFPTDVATPSFNTFGIDSCVHRIPGLSDYFFRASDDFFFGRPIPREDLNGSATWPVLLGGDALRYSETDYGKLIQANAISFCNRFGFMPRLNTLHAPQLRMKQTCEALVAEWADWFDLTRRSRFRAPTDAVVLFLYAYFDLWTHDREALLLFERMGETDAIKNVNRKPFDSSTIYGQLGVGGKDGAWRDKARMIAANRPRFFNLNDHLGSEPAREDIAFVRDLLYEMYPHPSRFELDGPRPGYAAVEPADG